MKTQKLGFMSRLRNRKGFSLVEIAVVLVIIGIIIGAVVKGQDLILNARAKQVTSQLNTWRNLSLAYLDRNGRMPGDFNKDGLIGSGTDNFAGSAAGSEISSTMTFAPANPIQIGSFSFYVYFGSVIGDPNTTLRNAIVICNKNDCSTAFSKDETELIKAVDMGIDGSADAGMGQFRAATDVGGTPATTSVANGANVIFKTAAGTTTKWDNAATSTYKAGVWAFDRPF